MEENDQKPSKQGYGTLQPSVSVDPPDPLDDVSIEEGDTGCCKRVYPNGFLKETRELWKLAWPMILTQLFQYALGPVAMIFCGHLGKNELDGVALANSLINVLGISIATGLATACDTLFAQIYGSTHRKQLGVFLQRALIIMFMSALPCMAVHLNAESLLVLIGQDPEVSRLAGNYLLIFFPGLVSFFLYTPLSKYIQNQNIVYPNLIIGFIVNILNVALHLLLLTYLGYGLTGSALAQMLSYVSMFVLTLIYILVSKVYKDTWEGWSVDSLQYWGLFYKLAVFGLAMICVEWWAFEAGIILTGLLGTTDLGAQSVLFQLEAIAYMLPLGTGIATSIRVGQFLGAGSTKGAQTSARVAVTLATGSGLVVNVLFITLNQQLPKIFTNVPEVIALAAEILPILGVYMVFDSIAGTCGGILRGSGRQNLGAGVITIGYVCALSSGIPLMFLTPLRTKGFWIMLAACITVEAITFAIIIARTDWDAQVQRAQVRVSHGHESSGTYEAGEPTHNVETADHNILAANQESTEKTALLSEDPIPPADRERRYSDRFSNPFPDMVVFTPPLTKRQLLLRRMPLFVFMVLILILGIIVRVYVSPDRPATTLCLPEGVTAEANSTLLPCLVTDMSLVSGLTTLAYNASAGAPSLL